MVLSHEGTNTHSFISISSKLHQKTKDLIMNFIDHAWGYSPPFDKKQKYRTPHEILLEYISWQRLKTNIFESKIDEKQF